MQYKESLDDSGSLKSLIVKLRALGLRLRAGGNIERQLEFAAKDENLTEEREKINRRGIVLESEMVTGGSSPLRVGQVWKIGDRFLEILAFRKDQLSELLGKGMPLGAYWEEWVIIRRGRQNEESYGEEFMEMWGTRRRRAS